jgi:hypothetical protein
MTERERASEGVRSVLSSYCERERERERERESKVGARLGAPSGKGGQLH